MSNERLTQNEYAFMKGLLTSQPLLTPIIRRVTKQLSERHLVRVIRELGETFVTLTSYGRTVIEAKEAAYKAKNEHTEDFTQ